MTRVTWGDIAARPRTVSQQVAGNLAVGGRAGEQRRVGLETSPQPGAHQVGWEDAGRDAEPSQSEQKGISLRRARNTLACLFSGCWRAAGPCHSTPVQPRPSLQVGGIHSGSLWWGAGGLHVSEFLFALPGWTCLYLLNEPGDSRLLGELASSTPTLPTTERRFHISHLPAGSNLFPNPAGILQDQEHPVPGGSDTPVAPGAWHALGRFWGGSSWAPFSFL